MKLLSTILMVLWHECLVCGPKGVAAEEALTLVIHRNGEPDSCGSAEVPKSKLRDVADIDNKYKMEAFLTDIVAETMAEKSSCNSPDNPMGLDGIPGFCDMGKDRTPVLLDNDELVRVKDGTLPCRWYTREGIRVVSFDQLESLVARARNDSKTCKNPNVNHPNLCQEGELHLYAVQAGRVFMFAPSYVGEKFELDHLSLVPDPAKPISMTVLSTNPRVFDILNVFTEEEADDLVDRALSETSPSNRIKRSTTGTNENSIFRRIFELLGFDEYWNGHDDGLQILRYNESKAYIQHMDYLRDKSDKELYDYDSSKKGGNRFATVLLYMNDLPDGAGGETVFSEALPPEVGGDIQTLEANVIEELRASGDLEAAGIKPGSWEEAMVATCRTRLSVKPSHGRAVLFYSQYPDGVEDPMSKHGGCPVLQGQTKWAANLWVWNAPRENYKNAPMREDLIAQGFKPPQNNMPKQLQATFTNTGKDPAMENAELFFEAMFWGKLGHGDPDLRSNTYEGHRWNVRVNGQVVKNLVIGKEPIQVFEI
eukprot:scaffold154_cov129-Cylindrotheca_fusiformis.AAC.13